MSRVHLVAAVVWALALGGCEEKPESKPGNEDELTIVVEADRSRIEVEEAALQERRRALEAERERLHQQISRIGEGREGHGGAEVQQLLEQAVRLVRQQEEIVSKRDALSRERDALLEKMMAGEARPIPVAQSASAELSRVNREAAEREKGVAARERTIAEREREVAEREKAIALREAALGEREASCTTAAKAPAAPASAELTRAAVTRAYKALLASMDAKGILPADLPAAKQKSLQQAGALSNRGSLARAMGAIEAAQAAVDAIAVDADFVSQKVKRVNAMKQRALEAKAQEEFSRLLQSVTRNYSDGRYLEANRALNDIAHLVERSGGR